MANVRSFVGLDAHASLTQAAVFDGETGELTFRRLMGPPREALGYLEDLPGPVLATYEAGPVGYGLARAAASSEIEVRVCAPGSVPRKPSARIKTDRRDAERLARLLAAGELTIVRVPSISEEHHRDLARCREAARGDLMRARHRLTRFLARREIQYEGRGKPWSSYHHEWLGQLELEGAPSRAVFADYLAAVVALEQRRSALDRAIEDAWSESPWAGQVAGLRCLRGIDTLTAFGLCAEVGEFRRFKRPGKLAAYLGIVPSEHSSAEVVRRGSITKAGSPFARRLLIEAAHHYQHRPAVKGRLERRQRGADPRAVEIGWRAQRRLHARWERLRCRRRKPTNVVVVGLARELCSFVWEVGQLR